jgi:glyoxylate reductase
MSAGFGMRVLYTSNSPKPEFEKSCGATFTDLETLLRESDFVSLHVPLTSSTKYMIGEKELRLMKKTAILINTARGPVIEEAALVRALKEGWIWGAGLDVYENEPILEPGLAELDNVVLLPHTGSATFEARANMGKIAARNIIAVLCGNKPETCINQEVLNQF